MAEAMTSHPNKKAKTPKPNSGAKQKTALLAAPPSPRLHASQVPMTGATFLADLGRQLGLKPVALIKALNTTSSAFYTYQKKNRCPVYIRERADALLAKAGLPPTIPEAAAVASKKQLVPAGFLDGLEVRLGLTNTDLAAKLGTTPTSLWNWREAGQCPAWVRAAASITGRRVVISCAGISRRARPASSGGRPLCAAKATICRAIIMRS